MPKGVEHAGKRSANRDQPKGVIQPLMPKGVEHVTFDHGAGGVGMGDPASDAERR